MSTGSGTVHRVLEALDRVHDPEVDEPITTMGFVRSVTQDDSGVVITLQLPTYFCAPNFTWIMVADARRAAEAVVGPGRVRVDLDGHFESDRIGEGVSSLQTFADTFEGADADAELEALRDRFRRKTFLVRQEHVCREAIAAGVPAEDLATLDLVSVAGLGLSSFVKYLTTREELGISCRHSAAFLVAADGCPVGADRVRAHRRSASVLALSFEGNGHLCRSLLAQRYPMAGSSAGHETEMKGEVA